MGKIKDKDIRVTRSGINEYTLAYVTGGGAYYHERYIGYRVREAKALFKEHIYGKDDNRRSL
jgi:hypothetical protein